jgi:hypothetical protein
MFKSLYALMGAALLLGACSEPQVQATSAPPPAQAPTYMVFFDWDRSDLSSQALATIHQAAVAFKGGGQPRLTVIGHTDTSGPENYNMALSLRRASVVKSALIREGLPDGAIATIGRGEEQPLVQTGDGVREPQNRRAEIVFGNQMARAVPAIFSDPAAYCRALWDRNREYKGMAIREAVGAYRCEEGNYQTAIPLLENGLIKEKIPLPEPGFRWPGVGYTPA